MSRSARIDLREWQDPRAAKVRRSRMQVVRRTEITAEQRHQTRFRLRRTVLIAGMILLTTAPAAWLVKLYAQSFAVQAVTIEGEFHNEQAHEIEQSLLPYVQGDFFTADLVNARAALLNLSWVKDVALRRRWPNRIIVQIDEQVPAAVWNQKLFLNDSAGVFNHKYVDQYRALPDLSGPQDSEREVLVQFFRWRELLEPAGLRLQTVKLDERYSWVLITADGVSINLGKEKIEERLQRFINVFPGHLEARMHNIQAIDLRYSNGFAVSWKSPVTNGTAGKRNRNV